MITDDRNHGPLGWTLVGATDLAQFAAGLHIWKFLYIDTIVVNTHSVENEEGLQLLYAKLNALWSLRDHTISFINYDVLSLRSLGSMNTFLEQNSVLVTEFEEELLTRRGNKMANLRNWLFFDSQGFLTAPRNKQLRQLNFYVESNFFNHFQSTSAPLDAANALNCMHNLAQVSELHLHSPLALIQVLEMLDRLGAPQLKLEKLSLASSHRVRNNARLDFGIINRFVDLNHVKELELKINCANHHECNNLCMMEFFEEWRRYNAREGVETNTEKLSLVHYKGLRETPQFKTICEQHIFSPHFARLREVNINLSNSVNWKYQDSSINLGTVASNLEFVPKLESLHITSFMCDWILHLPNFFSVDDSTGLDVLVNHCDCDACGSARTNFIELAELDKSNNYSHNNVKMKDFKPVSGAKAHIDFTSIANVKFLQYLTTLFRSEEACMERNLQSTGTMLNMEHMVTRHNAELDVFRELFAHSCLNEAFDKMRSRAHSLRTVNFGGISTYA